MRRRSILAALGGSVAMWPLAARAQLPRPVARIGMLATGGLDSADQQALFEAFRQGLRDRGYAEGQNIVIETRAAEWQVARFPSLADELVRLRLDVIVATNSLAARAVQRATATIPIVVPVMGDPVGDGLVASLARPGGNVTGLTFLGPELLPKRLALLKEALPSISRVAALWHPGAYGERTMREMIAQTEAAARTLDVQLRLVSVEDPADLDRAFADVAAERAEALIVYPSPMLFAARRQIVDLAGGQRLPLMAMGREFVELGGLMSYGASISDLHRRAAGYVDRILKGAKPADLPVEQATTFELAVNLKTAKGLGLTIPVAILVRADEVIE